MQKNAIHKVFGKAFAILIGALLYMLKSPIPTAAGAFWENPIQSGDFAAILRNIALFVYKIGLPVLTVMMMLMGLQFILAQGNEEKLKTARRNLVWVIIGGAIVLGAVTIANVVINFGHTLGP